MTDIEQPRFCAPNDFGGWHITTDGNETLCGIEVEGHHLSGTVGDEYDNTRDCPECREMFERQ